MLRLFGAVLAMGAIALTPAPASADAAAERVWAEIAAVGGANPNVPFVRTIDFDGIGLTETEVDLLLTRMTEPEKTRLDRGCNFILRSGGGFSPNTVAFCALFDEQLEDERRENRRQRFRGGFLFFHRS
jgi:hypothetical protein